MEIEAALSDVSRPVDQIPAHMFARCKTLPHLERKGIATDGILVEVMTMFLMDRAEHDRQIVEKHTRELPLPVGRPRGTAARRVIAGIYLAVQGQYPGKKHGDVCVPIQKRLGISRRTIARAIDEILRPIAKLEAPVDEIQRQVLLALAEDFEAFEAERRASGHSAVRFGSRVEQRPP